MAKVEQLIPKNKKIGVLYGGMSNERQVSLRSGKNCYDALLRLGYENVELIDVDENIAKVLADKCVEVAYIALHGKYGEDGCIQGLLEILGVPYVGCGPMSSAICMDKDVTKRVLSGTDIPIIKSVTFCDSEDLSCAENLTYPIMVKPISEGSSIGMSKVDSSDGLKQAIDEALKCSDSVMLEEFLDGVSVTVGVLDMANKTLATPILEFRTKTDWYDFEAKYTEGMTEFILPAEISDELSEKCKEFAIKAHKSVKATGMSRVDFLVSGDVAYLLEINTIPGMTDLSDLPAQAGCMGISYDDLVQIILNSANMKKN